jgi:xanthine dehydrogenase accessory factor
MALSVPSHQQAVSCEFEYHPVNNQRDFWQQLLTHMGDAGPCVVMCVVESIGSSPGRRGFKMCVVPGGGLFGSIGGGSMEHKLVELVRSLADRDDAFPLLKRQIHQADLGQDRSGMICSGEQTVAFFRLHGEADRQLVERIVAAMEDTASALQLELSASGMYIVAEGRTMQRSPDAWSYREALHAQPRIAIIGAGHVSLALSRVMDQLGFRVEIYDDRQGLNTWDANTFAQQRTLVNYERIGDHLPDDPDLYVVLASFGYRTDDRVLRQLISRRFRYIGMLGSAEKVRVLFAALRADGVAEDLLARVHAPIGLPIHSRTPEEIAVSIAAQVIGVKNTQ